MGTESSNSKRCSSKSARDAALNYPRRGWSPLPLPFRSKNPGESIGKKWQDFRTAPNDIPKYFNGSPQNIGVILGEPSGGLCDCDLDSPQALEMADAILPRTSAVFGRKSTPRAHRLYRCPGITRIEQFKDIDGSMLVELRSTGGQTIFPPSVHPDGELIEWVEFGEPEIVSADDLRRAVVKLAAGCLIARHWPQFGGREDAAMALAGGLIRAGWTQDEVAGFLLGVANAACDEEAQKRAEAARTTGERIKLGGPATGWPTLIELLGQNIVTRASTWLRLDLFSNLNVWAEAIPRDPASDGDHQARPVEARPTVLVPGLHPTSSGDLEVSTFDFSTAMLDACQLDQSINEAKLLESFAGSQAMCGSLPSSSNAEGY